MQILLNHVTSINITPIVTKSCPKSDILPKYTFHLPTPPDSPKMSSSPIDVTSSSRLSPVLVRTKPCDVRLSSSEVTRKMTSHDVRRLTSSPVTTDGVTSPPHRPSPVRCCDTGKIMDDWLYFFDVTSSTCTTFPDQHYVITITFQQLVSRTKCARPVLPGLLSLFDILLLPVFVVL